VQGCPEKATEGRTRAASGTQGDQVQYNDEGRPVGPIFKLSRPPDGRIMCSICFDYRWPDELFVDAAGQRWDLCGGDKTCAAEAGYRDGSWPEDRTLRAGE
jgi:hypothetical protein